MRGKLLGEWGELVGFDRRESEWVKNFLTRTEDAYRDPYGALTKTWPRTISFVATTNQQTYLRDLGGRRRYWPVQVGKIDLRGLERDAPMLWGEAVRLYKSGCRFWIDKNSPEDARFRMLCDREQRSRLDGNAYDDMANDLADRLVHGGVIFRRKGIEMMASEWTCFPVQEMTMLLLGYEMPAQKGEWMLMAAALKRCGWSNAKDYRLPDNSIGWGLTPEKAEEIRRRNGLGGPPPKPAKSMGHPSKKRASGGR